MTTNEPLRTSLEAAQFGTPPDPIVKKEQELAALLDRVLNAPLKPVRDTLGDLLSHMGLNRQKLTTLADELNSIGESVDKLGKTAKKSQKNQEAFEEDLRLRLKEVAQAVQAADTAAGRRNEDLLEAVRAMRDEAQEAAKSAARQSRTALIVFAVLLAAVVGHIAIDVVGRLPRAPSAELR